MLIFIILLVFFRINMHLFFSKDNATFDPVFIDEVEAFLQQEEKEAEKAFPETTSRRSSSLPPVSKAGASRLFDFDPNTITDQEWYKLGISEDQLRVINNYKKSGGRFFEKEDLKRIYGMDERTYARIEKHIRIERKPLESREITKSTKEALPVIEINTADTFSLTLIRGIGPAYARRICKYRDLLGGFSSMEQLKEVYGITDELAETIDSTIHIDLQKIRKMDVNEAKFAELIRHPYLSEYQTRAIISYRQYKERIDDLRELLANKVLDEETYHRMKPYLRIEEE